MTTPLLYRGVWPQNVSKLAKYAVRFVKDAWKVTVLYEAGAGLKYLAVEGDGAELAARVNAVKTALQGKPGGAFYVNEYRHVIVPVTAPAGSGAASYYYGCGRLATDLTFEFEGQPLTTRPVGPAGTLLKPGGRWIGPRPGIPYVLAAGASDIYYESPAISDDNPPQVLPSMTRRVYLSKVLKDKVAAQTTLRAVASIKGHQGGRFYVNEHQAIFTPKDVGDGNGLDYIYCGQIDRNAWFPEPQIAQ